MLSKKMAVSLTSLIIILALAFVVPSAMAQFDVEIQGPTVLTYTATGTALPEIFLIVESPHAIQNSQSTPAAALVVADWEYSSYDSNGFQVTATTTPAENSSLEISTADDLTWPERTASRRRVGVTITPTAPTTTLGTEAVFVLKLAAFTTPDVRVIDNPATADPVIENKSNPATHEINIQMVPANAPKVVSIQRLRPGTQPVLSAFQESAVSGAFNIRIVLTEAHPGLQDGADDTELRNDRILVEGGEPSGLVIGSPFFPVGLNSDNASVVGSSVVAGTTTTPHPLEGQYSYDSTSPVPANAGLSGVPQGADGMYVPLPTGNNGMYSQYQMRITPYARSTEVRISVRAFDNGATPNRTFYVPTDVANKPNGREQLRLDVVQDIDDRAPGFELPLPDPNDAKIPVNGFYLLVRDKVGSGIDWSEEADAADRDKVENVAAKQTPAQLFYNVRASLDLPNLETFLVNNGTIELVAYGDRQGVNTTLAFGDIYISEVMWGSDAGLPDPRGSQWIEIATSGPARDIGDSRLSLHFYGANETPPENYVREQNGALGTVLDRIGTKASDTGLGWSIVGKGQSGRTSVEGGRDAIAISPRDRLISMYRMMVAGAPGEGTMEDTWVQATGPAVNFRLPLEGTLAGSHIGTPGSAEFMTPDETAAADAADAAAQAAAQAAADAAAEAIRTTGTYPMPGDGRVYISEVMFAGGGILPQWIEISNGDRAKPFNLSGWTLTVDNAAADADVSVGKEKPATFTIPDGTMIDPSAQDDTPSTILIVTEKGRTNMTGPVAAGQIINLAEDREAELIVAGVVTGKYALLSDKAFMITLAPPEPEATKAPAGETAAAKATRQAAEKKAANNRKAATDRVGNLGDDGAAAWALSMSDEGRSSIIRRHIQVARGPAAPEDGTKMENWTLASDTAFADVTHIRAQSYYGAANDVGTPGFRSGGVLPVELSHFRPARQDTGQVVITWSTQSELNNAGFFIKRAQQRNGEFKVINATMIPGAGTTSEKQFYTYTDTTAQPNVVYYYQIEDVSLDGHRQTLTLGTRLRGHIGAAGKATTTWGELKTSHE